MSQHAPGAKPCKHCGSENLIVEGVNKSVICLNCCATGPSAIGYVEYNGLTEVPQISIALWNVTDGTLLTPEGKQGANSESSRKG